MCNLPFCLTSTRSTHTQGHAHAHEHANAYNALFFGAKLFALLPPLTGSFRRDGRGSALAREAADLVRDLDDDDADFDWRAAVPRRGA